MYIVYFVTFVDADCVELLACVVSCMKKNSLKTLCLWGMEGVPQCCEVFDSLRSNEIEEFEFDLYSTSLPVSVMMIEYYLLHFTLPIHHSGPYTPNTISPHSYITLVCVSEMSSKCM